MRSGSVLWGDINTTLYLKPSRFTPAPSVELDPEHILCNDITLPHDNRHLHNMRLWIIGNECGAMGAVWASHEGDAIDELIDADLAGGILIDEEDVAKMTEEEQENVARGGNAGEPYDSQYLWMAEVEWNPARDWALIVRFAEARGASVDNLSEI